MRNVLIANRVFFVIFFIVSIGSCASKKVSVSDVQPSLGLVSGKTTVTIRTSGMTNPGSADVYFGNKKSGAVAFSPNGDLVTTAPPSDRPGPVDVRVIIDGKREFLVSGAFTYVQKDEMAECVNISRQLNGEDLSSGNSALLR